LSVEGLYIVIIPAESEVFNMNTNENNNALVIAKAYFEAMANKDIEKLMTLVSDKVTTTSPLGNLEGRESFQNFAEGFARMINKLTLITAFGDNKEAVIVYHSNTIPVPDATVAEYIVVEDNKISSVQVIYDGTPFAAYAATQSKH
jgi:ketosteroid isomerase-like protein